MIYYEYEILILSILGLIIALLILSIILERFFPKNKLSKFLEDSAEWVKENIRI